MMIVVEPQQVILPTENSIILSCVKNIRSWFLVTTDSSGLPRSITSKIILQKLNFLQCFWGGFTILQCVSQYPLLLFFLGGIYLSPNNPLLDYTVQLRAQTTQYGQQYMYLLIS